MYLHTVALQIGSVNGATAALVVGETVVPGILGVLWLGDASRPGFAWVAVLGFVVAVAGAVAVAWFGEPEADAGSVAGDEAAGTAAVTGTGGSPQVGGPARAAEAGDGAEAGSGQDGRPAHSLAGDRTGPA